VIPTAANKVLILAAACNNLKKWLKFTAPKTAIKAMALLQTKSGESFCTYKNRIHRIYCGPKCDSLFF
jgi:hypothetical protein